MLKLEYYENDVPHFLALVKNGYKCHIRQHAFVTIYVQNLCVGLTKLI